VSVASWPGLRSAVADDGDNGKKRFCVRMSLMIVTVASWLGLCNSGYVDFVAALGGELQ
jgi:hypothetical protein